MVFIKYFRHHFKPEIYGYGYKGLLKQGMMECPSITVCGIACPLVVMISTPITYYLDKKTKNDRRRYFYRYNIFRPDDDKLDWMVLPPKLEAELQEIRSRAA